MAGDAKARIRSALLGAWNDGRLELLDELLAPDYQREVLRAPSSHGAEELKRSISELRSAFPDLDLTIGEMTEEGPRVVWEWCVRGTHDGSLFGLPPTHRPVELSGMTSSTFDGERITYDRVTSGSEEMLSLQGVFQLAGMPDEVDAIAGEGNALDPQVLRAVHRTFATGVTIVTASVDDEPRGLVLNAFASVSLEPPLVLVAVNRATATHEFLFRGDAFAINILASDQVEIARRFSRPIANKFDGIAWKPGANSAPVIEGATACIEARVQERRSVGTHTVFLGKVTGARVSDAAPLIYLDGRFHDTRSLVELEEER